MIDDVGAGDDDMRIWWWWWYHDDFMIMIILVVVAELSIAVVYPVGGSSPTNYYKDYKTFKNERKIMNYY